MGSLSLEQFANRLASLEGAVIALWIGLAILSVTLFVLSRTRWGQQRPLRKCLVLSILAHVLLMGYATTVKIVAGIPVRDPEPFVHISLDNGNPWDSDTPPEEGGAPLPSPWTSHHDDTPAQTEALELAREEVAGGEDSPRHSQTDELGTTPLAPTERVALVAPVQSNPDSPPSVSAQREMAPVEDAAAIDAPEPERRDAPESQLPDASSEQVATIEGTGAMPIRQHSAAGVASALLQQPVSLPRLADLPMTVQPSDVLSGPDDTMASSKGTPAELAEAEASETDSETDTLRPSALAAAAVPPAAMLANLAGLAAPSPADVTPANRGSDTVGPPVLGQVRLEHSTADVPQVYRLRVAPDRSEIAKRYGATDESEAAVRDALKWLADNQERDGRWSPTRHRAGKEQRVLGRDRFGAGARADTGISALALLALLASGHTHEDGAYRENVERGLEFLLRSQASDGNLGGRATTYAFMYCHAMATFALSEAYGMTGDRRLEAPVRRAVMFTITAQNPTTGGWRYKIGDEGDTSQLGWQLMALKSADLAGIPMPTHTRQGAIRYLESVSSGRFGGLAAYRPVEAPSRPMTAEALACRHFLGIPPQTLAATEAGEYLLGELPGEGDANFYYWYYGTLGLYQTQSGAWDQWNTAMQRTLLARQRKSGDLAGSWDPDTVWGGYGGRVYTTALATLCLEVYYRFMPLYLEAATAAPTLR